MDERCAGTLCLLLGMLQTGLRLDYPILCAWAGVDGDYRKVAVALHALRGWNVQHTLGAWVVLSAAMPFVVFTSVFWPLRSCRLRVLPQAHAIKMVCNTNWLSAASAVGGGGDESIDSRSVSVLLPSERVSVRLYQLV